MTVRRLWDAEPPQGGTAVVIDVLRFSTTICALLKAGRKAIWVAQTPQALQQAPEPEGADVYSELKFDWPGRHVDNSPTIALSDGGRECPAYVTTTSGSRALWASRAAERVLIGGFANFSALVDALRQAPEPLSFVPAAPPVKPSAVEDELCAEAFAEALQGRAGAAQRAIERWHATPRPAEYFGLGLPTGRSDFDLCFAVDGIPLLPQAAFPPENERLPFASIRRSA